MHPGDRSPVALLVAERFGGPTVPVISQPIVGVAPATRVLQNHPGRFSWMIINRGTTQVDLWFTPSLVAGQGIPVAPNAWVSEYWEEDGEQVTWEVWAVSTAAAQQLFIAEARRE